MKKNDLKRWFDSKKVDLILMKNLWITKKELFFLEEIDNSFLKNINLDLERLKAWEPIEYIIEKANFFWKNFFVDSRVLIPRNDTEIIIYEVLKIDDLENFLILDIWTWSSAIISSIFMNSKAKKWFAIDISKKALEVAKINIKKFWLEEKITLLENDLLGNIDFLKNLNFDKFLITANLPYVKDWDFENMSTETVYFEPNIALFWWKNTGFELYEKLIRQCLQLKKQIILFIEIWFDQKEFAENFLKNLNLKFEFFRDNSWIERCVKIFF